MRVCLRVRVVCDREIDIGREGARACVCERETERETERERDRERILFLFKNFSRESLSILNFFLTRRALSLLSFAFFFFFFFFEERQRDIL